MNRLRQKMMTGACEETARLFSDYADGELRGFRRLRLRFHLATCNRCRAVLAGLRRTLAALGLLREVLPAELPELPALVAERIRAGNGAEGG